MRGIGRIHGLDLHAAAFEITALARESSAWAWPFIPPGAALIRTDAYIHLILIFELAWLRSPPVIRPAIFPQVQWKQRKMSAMDVTESTATPAEGEQKPAEEPKPTEEKKAEEAAPVEEPPKAAEPPQQAPAESTESATEPEKKDAGGDSDITSTMNSTIPTRQYLDQTVVPILLQALGALAKERPPNPIEYLANYLLKEKDRFAISQNEATPH
uniref:Dpy-30 histone methyltransferase complex regulatory subunit n=2 Tax=Ascaris TaxID=6251 RepID=A0A9J2PII9_ASCLU